MYVSHTLCCIAVRTIPQFLAVKLCRVTVVQCIMDAVKTPAKGKYACVFSVSDQWEKSEHCFFCDRDWLRAGTLPSVPRLIYMHRWHGISIVTAPPPPKKAQRTNGRYLAADTQGPITIVRLHSPLLRGFLISQPCALLGTVGLSSNCQPV